MANLTKSGNGNLRNNCSFELHYVKENTIKFSNRNAVLEILIEGTEHVTSEFAMQL